MSQTQSKPLSLAAQRIAAAVALLRARARASRRAALALPPSEGKTHLERIAARWEIMAQAEASGAVLRAANDG